jgi:hypothetical protein
LWAVTRAYTGAKMDFILYSQFVVVDDDGDVITVGFADQELGPERYVTLQTAREYDQQDILLGMKAPHIEVNYQLFSEYGAIASIKMHGNEVRISLTPKGHKVLKIDGEIIVTTNTEAPPTTCGRRCVGWQRGSSRSR